MNIAEILKDAPKGTKLYCTLFGEVILEEVKTCGIYIINQHNERSFLDSKGNFYTGYDGSECVLFPSKENRDWATFKVDLPIDTPVMVKSKFVWGTTFQLKYYAGNNTCWEEGLKSTDTKDKLNWGIIIPFDKFNPLDIEESLKHNIVK